jgi:hypothetical protein
MKVTVRIERDDDCFNPMDFDGSWTLYSFGSRGGNDLPDPASATRA